jgi:alpha-beta hydrolase superfamily lysophospholipase
MFVHCYAAGLWALEQAAAFPLPLLLIHGSQDKLTSPQGSQEFAEKNKDKVSFRLFEGMYHETHHEIGKEEVFKTIGDWLGLQLKNASVY